MHGARASSPIALPRARLQGWPPDAPIGPPPIAASPRPPRPPFPGPPPTNRTAALPLQRGSAPHAPRPLPALPWPVWRRAGGPAYTPGLYTWARPAAHTPLRHPAAVPGRIAGLGRRGPACGACLGWRWARSVPVQLYCATAFIVGYMSHIYCRRVSDGTPACCCRRRLARTRLSRPGAGGNPLIFSKRGARGPSSAWRPPARLTAAIPPLSRRPPYPPRAPRHCSHFQALDRSSLLALRAVLVGRGELCQPLKTIYVIRH
ncbi:MAG: hypothetical protein J3K34DRAFT_409026 [Monoraphidium minutum]|nr:MAG: hypothetical protein J3K34DRAFT_409026 [Monoraphidium minutum]